MCRTIFRQVTQVLGVRSVRMNTPAAIYIYTHEEPHARLLVRSFGETSSNSFRSFPLVS